MIYSQLKGQLYTDDGVLIGTGYAGNGIYKNDPNSQCVMNHGPLPRGWYTAVSVEDSQQTGPFSIILVPDEGNEIFGRSGFRMHGDNLSDPGNGSDGCIVMPRTVREQFWNGKDHRISVVE